MTQHAFEQPALHEGERQLWLHACSPRRGFSVHQVGRSGISAGKGGARRGTLESFEDLRIMAGPAPAQRF